MHCRVLYMVLQSRRRYEQPIAAFAPFADMHVSTVLMNGRIRVEAFRMRYTVPTPLALIGWSDLIGVDHFEYPEINVMPNLAGFLVSHYP